MRALVGYSGFVGANLDRQAHFDAKYNTQNITQAYGTSPELLVYAGIRAEKYLANNDPALDLQMVREGFENIRRINPKRLILISTADVYKLPVQVDETTPIDTAGLHAYGLNRYQLEVWVRELYPDATIVRLPGLYGKGIKKNFIYDYIQRIPFMLTAAKFAQLTAEDGFIAPYYQQLPNGFYQCHYQSEDQRLVLKGYFERVGFSALQFTDSRSQFQFYPLRRLWDDIRTITQAGLKLVNIVTEPVTAGELYAYLTDGVFDNELGRTPAVYDIHSVHTGLFASSTPYMLDKAYVLEDIRAFIGRSE